MPTPGARNIPLAATRSSAGSTWVGPTTAPIGPISPGARRALSSPMVTNRSSFDAATAESDGGLDRTAFGVGGVGHHEQAASSAVGAGDQGAHRSQAQIWMHGESVGSEGGVCTQVGLGVGVVGGSDVTPFGVHDDQQTCAARFGDQTLQRPEPLPAMSFVECRLELDQAHRPAAASSAISAKRSTPSGRPPYPRRRESRLRDPKTPGRADRYRDRTAPKRMANESAMPPSMAEPLGLKGRSSPTSTSTWHSCLVLDEYQTLARRIGDACRLTGEFTLRSGQARRLTSTSISSRPTRCSWASSTAGSRSDPEGTEVLAGLELGGVPVATALSLATGLPSRVRSQAGEGVWYDEARRGC